jgi:DNA-binding transcriptional LysR family regulator
MFESLFARGGLSLDRMRGLLEMAEAGSIAKAAPNDLNRQSLISRQIGELEEFFGTELTVRRDKSLALSPAGERLVALVREQFRDLMDFQLEQKQQRKSFAVGAGASMIEWLVIPALGGIRETLGGASLKLASLRSREVVAAVRDGRIDFGIVREDALGADALALPLVEISFPLCVPEILAGSRRGGELDDPAFWNTLPFAANSGGGQLDSLFRAAMTKACGSFRPAVECDSLLQIRELVVRGTCAGVLTSMGARGLAEHAVFVREFEPLEQFGRKLVLHWNKRQMSPRGVDERTIRRLATVLEIGPDQSA